MESILEAKMSDRLEVVSDATFAQQVEGSSEPYLVEFMTPLCAPCAALTPVLEAIADDQVGKLRIGQLNVADHPATAERFGVRSTPTMILFRSGEPVLRLIGFKNKRNVIEALSDSV
jgi:thioredoxin 1